MNDLKTKKTLKYLSVRVLRVGRTYLVWQNLESVSAVRKGVSKAGFLTGVYILQSINMCSATELLIRIVDCTK